MTEIEPEPVRCNKRSFLFNMISLDGFFSGPNGEIDWHNVDEEFNEFAIDQLNTAGGLIFGRVTYLGMASYWPTLKALVEHAFVPSVFNLAFPLLLLSLVLYRRAGLAIGGKDKGEAVGESPPVDLKDLLP